MSGAFETSFQRLDQLCRRDPACALTSVGVVAAFDEIAARLAAAPVSSPSGAVLTKTALQDIAATLIDFETLWPRGHRRAASTLLRPFLHRRLDSAVYGVAVV